MYALEVGDECWVWYDKSSFSCGPGGGPATDSAVGWHRSFVRCVDPIGQMEVFPLDGRVRASRWVIPGSSFLIKGDEKPLQGIEASPHAREVQEYQARVRVSFTMDFYNMHDPTPFIGEMVRDYWEEARSAWENEGDVEILELKPPEDLVERDLICQYCEDYQTKSEGLEPHHCCPGCWNIEWVPVDDVR